MLSATVASLVVVGLIVWVTAVLDLIRATDMEQTGRLILAAVVIFAAPIGILLWLAVRGGRVGGLVAVSIGALAVGIVISLAAAAMPSPRPVQIRALQQQTLAVPRVVLPSP
jgi:cytochrome bd-type quinol oxidase subunit 2